MSKNDAGQDVSVSDAVYVAVLDNYVARGELAEVLDAEYQRASSPRQDYPEPAPLSRSETRAHFLAASARREGNARIQKALSKGDLKTIPGTDMCVTNATLADIKNELARDGRRLVEDAELKQPGFPKEGLYLDDLSQVWVTAISTSPVQHRRPDDAANDRHVQMAASHDRKPGQLQQG